MEKSILVAVELDNNLKESLKELEQLCLTAGTEIVATLTQKRERPDPKFFIGTGKIEELKALIADKNPDLIIFDHELSPAQNRNLDEVLDTKVIDRTELILDIFAQHAHSREGKIQVELAQLNFRMTRLTGWGKMLSRLGGGIGTRGPGETKLEADRRKIKNRLSILKKEIEKLRQVRRTKRESRRSNQIKIAGIIGYTNAGKSTLLNALARSNVLVQNKLFATLDPTTRRLYLPSGKIILITDTVGFIQKLPHLLVEAFKATLEEVAEADILLHVVDISNPFFENQIDSVYNVLEELKISKKTIITVFNKIDRLECSSLECSSKACFAKYLEKYKPAVAISALKKDGLDKLLAEIDSQFREL